MVSSPVLLLKDLFAINRWDPSVDLSETASGISVVLRKILH